MKVEQKCLIKNEFTVRVEDIVTGKVDEYKAYNLVLNQMWSRLVNFQAYFVNIHFGTGSGTLAATRTSLFTHLGTKAAVTELQERALPTSRWVRRIVLNPEEFVGQTITEVGVAFGATNTNLVTHAFLQDAEGNPISLTKTDTQVFTIYATIFYTLTANSSYGDKIRLVQPLTNNEWLSYLMGATYPTQQFRVTRAPEFSNGTAPGSHGQSANITIADWIKDAANKRATTPVRRLGVSVGNGEVRGFGLGSSDTLGTFRGQFPIAGVYTGKAITETIGAGDGAKKGFNLSWNDPAGLAIEIDEVPIDAGDYDVLPVKKGTNLLAYIAPQIISGEPLGELPMLTDGSISTSFAFGMPSVVLGIDIGSSRGVNKFRVYSVNSGNLKLEGANNSDFSDSVPLVTVSTTTAAAWSEGEFTPAAYRYFRIIKDTWGHYAVTQIELLAADDQITFHAPPASGTITADYTVPYVPKDSNHVLDLQATIQYGEIV